MYTHNEIVFIVHGGIINRDIGRSSIEKKFICTLSLFPTAKKQEDAMLCHSKNSGQPFGAEQKEGALYYCYDVFEEVTRKQNMVTSNNAQGIKRVEKVNNRHKQTRRTSKNSFLLLEDCGKKVPHPFFKTT